MQQISDDLHAAIQDPIGGASTEPPGAVPVRRFGLSGSQHELRFDVLQITPQQGNPIPVGNRRAAVGEAPVARVPELRTIYYEFRDPNASEDVTGELVSGLIRRELDFETPVEPMDELGLTDPVADFGGGSVEGGETASDVLPDDPADTSMIWVPEVVGVEFRYYDGNAWTSSWDSLQRKSLPVAVEVVLRVADSDVAALGQPIAEDEEYSDLDTVEAQGTPFRVIVDLPGSPAYRKPRPRQTTATRPPPRLPVRRIAPPRRQPAKPAVRIAPEEWIRTKSR